MEGATKVGHGYGGFTKHATKPRLRASSTFLGCILLFLPLALNQGEGAARLRVAPARARRGRLSIKTPMCRHTALRLGCRFHMH